MRHFLVCKKGKGTRRELLGLYIVSDVPQLRLAVQKKAPLERCLVLESEKEWEIGLVGRINPNQKKAFVESAFFSDVAINEASNLDKWRAFDEIV